MSSDGSLTVSSELTPSCSDQLSLRCGNRRPGEPSPSLFLNGDDLSPEWPKPDRDHLEVRQPEGDADDGQAEHHAGDDVQQRQPPPGDEEPDDVADRRSNALPWLWNYGTPKRPDAVERDPQRRHTERDRDDQDEADQR